MESITLIDARLDEVMDHIEMLAEVLEDVRKNGMDPWEVLVEMKRNIGSAQMLLRGAE